MIGLLPLAGMFVLAQDPVNSAAYRDPDFGVSVDRPFADWIWVPDRSRGTTTVIFLPRAGALSDQLWGALVMTHWDEDPDIARIAEQRERTSWRPQLGTTFRLLSRDAVMLGGRPAVRQRMSGSIARAVLEVEEYVVANGRDLVLLQLRYPRGLPRDSIAAGYARTIAGLRFDAGIETAAAPTAAEGRPAYRLETRAIGRLTLKVWRCEACPGATPATDERLALLARGWAAYWRAFGPIPLAELTVMETDSALTRGERGVVRLGADAGDAVMLRELARTWWGGFLSADSTATSASALIHDDLPAWSPRVLGVAPSDDAVTRTSAAGVSRLDAARAAMREARFREALRELAAQAVAGRARDLSAR